MRTHPERGQAEKENRLINGRPSPSPERYGIMTKCHNCSGKRVTNSPHDMYVGTHVHARPTHVSINRRRVLLPNVINKSEKIARKYGVTDSGIFHGVHVSPICTCSNFCKENNLVSNYEGERKGR